MLHPRYDSYTRRTIGINYVGSMGVDVTDRSPLFASHGRSGSENGEPHLRSEEYLFFGALNWMEIAAEAISIRGRRDVVDFCCDLLVPALCELSFDADGKLILPTSNEKHDFQQRGVRKAE